MLKRYKRMLALISATFILCFSVTTVEVQAQNALDPDAITDILVVAGAVVTTETAIGFCLSMLGLTAAAEAVYQNRDSIVEWCDSVKTEFIDFCQKSKEWASLTASEIQLFLEEVATGVLDTADDCFSALKDFVSYVYNSGSSGFEDTFEPSCSLDLQSLNAWKDSGVIDKLTATHKYVGDAETMYSYNNYLKHEADGHIEREDVPFFGQFKNSEGKYQYRYRYFTPFNSRSITLRFPIDGTKNYIYDYYEVATLCLDGGFSISNYRYFPVSKILKDDSRILSFSQTYQTIDFSGHTFLNLKCGDGINNPTWNSSSMEFLDTQDIIQFPMSQESFLRTYCSGDDARYCSLVSAIMSCYVYGIPLEGIPIDDGISEEETQEYIVDGSIGDVIERDGNLDNVDVVDIANPANPVIEFPVEEVGDISKPFPLENVKPIDRIQDVVLPDNVPIEDYPKPVTPSDSKEYTISGLEQFFPFCIPFDLYKLFQVLGADAKAPKFTWKFPIGYDSKGKIKYKELEIDLSDFDSVAKILRTMELYAFMIFLTLKTRDLIRG